jgi:hypothetical protein
LKAVFNWVCRVDITASKQSSRCRWKEEKSIPGARRVEAVSIHCVETFRSQSLTPFTELGLPVT